MTSIHELPGEMLEQILSYFVFTDPWQAMLRVCKEWRGIVSVLVPIRRKEWKDHIHSLEAKIAKYSDSSAIESIEERANRLYDTFLEAAHLPKDHFQNLFFRQLTLVYSNAHSIYQSMRLKHLLGSLIRHRLKGEILILLCSTFLRDSKDAVPQVAAMGIRQLTDISLAQHPMFREYAWDAIRENLHRNSFECESAALLNLSKLVHVDDFWVVFRGDVVLHNEVPNNLIPSYAILAAEMKRAKRIENVARYFSVNQFMDHYHTWNLWQRCAVLRLIATNLHSIIHANEYTALIEFLMGLVMYMCSDRARISRNCAEFFTAVDVLRQFCLQESDGELLAIELLHLLAPAMALFQYDYPDLIEIVHGFLVKCRQLILLTSHNGTAEPELVENFFPLWCDDSAVSKRKLWFVRRLTCLQNVTGVKLELEQLIKHEENLTVKLLAEDILEGVKLVR